MGSELNVDQLLQRGKFVYDDNVKQASVLRDEPATYGKFLYLTVLIIFNNF